MDWLEVISVRTAGKDSVKEAWRVCRRILPPPAAEQSVTVYRSVGYDTDLSIHIVWHVRSRIPGKSTLGLQLAFALCDFGVVSHTVWIDHHKTLASDEYLNP